MIKIQKFSTALILFVIVALSLMLRLTGLNWDDYSRLHPDERFLTTIASRIGSPSNLIDEARERCPDLRLAYDFFNTDCSFYNPDNINRGSYAYGTLPLFIVHGAAQIVAGLNPGTLSEPQMWTSYDYIHLVGRFVNGVADTLAVVVVFFIGRRLFTPKHGLVAAALYGFAILPIQQAHFWTVDSISTLFFVLGFWASVEVAKTERFLVYLLFGAALGCAAASRINLLPMAALLPLAVLIRLQTQGRLRKWRSWIVIEFLLILAAFCAAALVFRVTQPYAFVGPTISNWSLSQNWLNEISYVSGLSSTASDGWPPSVQWFERAKYIYPWFNMMVWGMGVIVGVAATLALIGALLSQLFRLRLSVELGLLSLWVIGYFAIVGRLHLMTMRYYLPLYPALFLLVAWAIFAAARWNTRRQQILVAVVVGSTFIWGASLVTNIYTHPITRIEASAWVNDNILPSVALYDEDGGHIPVTIPRDVLGFMLQPSFNGESYLGDPFELNQNQQMLGFEVRFTDDEPTQVQIQLMREESGSQISVAQFNKDTDENGIARIEFDEIPGIAAGFYRWHVAATWRGNEEVRQFLPSYSRREGEGSRQMPVTFRSPYQAVNFGLMLPEQTTNLFVERSFIATEFSIAHVLDEPAEIRVTTLGETYTATPEAAPELLFNSQTTLGQPVRYVLDRPMAVDNAMPITLQADAPMYFTGTLVAHEGSWEDSLPARFCNYSQPAGTLGVNLWRDCLEEHSVSRDWFIGLALNMAETDSTTKYQRMTDILSKADYLIMSSNRFYDAQPRVMRRFAMSSEYYDRLFGGDINYTLLETFRRGSNILGLHIPHDVIPTDGRSAWWNELEAEEAFTVYDHPTVFVFRNDGFTVDLFPEFVSAGAPGSTAAAAIESLDLATLPEATYQLATEPLQNRDVLAGLTIWTVGFLLLGWCAFPLMFVLFPSLPLRGFSIGRSLGWLVISIVPWWLTSVVGGFFWTRVGLVVLLAAFIALNAFIAYRRRVELTAYLRAHWKTLLFTEVVFLLALLFGLLLRTVNPDLWQVARGGEKPMDFAYLNAVLRTPVFPPPNPWFSGYAINYYYFGFIVAAAPIKIAGIASEIGYNLAMGTLYAVISANVFTLAYALIPSRRRRERLPLAAVGALFAMVAGNLGTLKQIVAPEPGMSMHRWYWYPTRILGESANRAGGAINEIPLFSFLFGDLHAHIIGLLPAMFYLTMLWVLVKQKHWWIGFFIGATAGMIYMTNTWDVLLYVPLGIVAIWLATRHVMRFIAFSIPVVIGGVVAFAPYTLSFTFGQASGIEAWHGERSLIEPFVLVWGIPIGIAALWMLHRLRRILPIQINSESGRGVPIAVFLIVITILLALQPVTATTILLAALTIPAIVLAVFDDRQVRFTHVGIAVMFGILLAIEYIVVQGDVGRMNTVFKISFQLWIWAGLLIPVILFFMLRERRYVSAGVMLILVGFGLLYPFYAIPARYDESVTQQLTLDGGRFLNVIDLSEGEAQPDAELIRYMRGNLTGFPVIAEWYQSEYRWNSRVSVQTGLPAVIGWANHMRQQYSPISPQVDQRIVDLQMLYTSGDTSMMQQIIDEYDIQYIVLGVLERQFMNPDGIIAFDQMEADGDLIPVYEGIETVLYQVAQNETAADAP